MEEKSFFQRLKTGLSKTRESWGQKLGGLLQSRQWDEESLDAVEEMLISADVGTKATQKLIEALRRQRPGERHLPRGGRHRLGTDGATIQAPSSTEG